MYNINTILKVVSCLSLVMIAIFLYQIVHRLDDIVDTVGVLVSVTGNN